MDLLIFALLLINSFDVFGQQNASNESSRERDLSYLGNSSVSTPSKTERKKHWSRELTNYLLSQHNKDAPPDGIIDIEYELELVHILQIDELKQTLTALVYIDERWMDDSLSWSPEDFGGLQKTWIPVQDIWKPDVVDLLSAMVAPATVFWNGTVECSQPAVYTVSCEINIKHFPLDDQKCALEIASWAYSDEKLRLHPHVEHNLQHYTPNEEWQLLNVTVIESKYVHEDISVNELHYEISVRRKPLFYFIVTVFPSYVMCAITVIGLFARASTTSERIERFTLGVMATITSTSTAVLSLVVSEKVPHSSTAIPLLVAYFLFNMCVLSVSVILTAFVLRVHRGGRHGDEPPDWAMRLFVLPIKKRPKKHSKDVEKIVTNNNGPRLSISESIPPTEDVVRVHRRLSAVTIDSPLNRKISALEIAMNRLCEIWQGVEKSYEEIDNEVYHAENNGYVRIAERLDWLFMIIFLTLLTAPVLYLYIYL